MMESIKEIYKIGSGPSSSHTMGPKKAAEMFLKRQPDAARYEVTLFGSLAATGRGHLTDWAIEKVFKERKLKINWRPDVFLPRHSNALSFTAFNDMGVELDSWTAYSVGGGTVIDDFKQEETKAIYELTTLDEILQYCDDNGLQIWEYVEEVEGKEIWDYLSKVWRAMSKAVEKGLDEEGTLPGALKLPRKAASYYTKAKNFSGKMERRSMIFAYALAVSEQNASGGTIVTAPTCGACGVVPAVLKFVQTYYNASEKKILRALATAGLIGNLVKYNASISGAEVGCQGEVGTACAMASAAATQLFGGSIFQIEYSAEMGLEHHLGLTCDPIAGLVQIPCIERNAFAAARALNHNTYVLLSDGRHRITFDEVVRAMKQTGHDLPSLYKETSTGGLAVFHSNKKDCKA
ncbi:L-serine ammonia-lyase [Carboxylicivirga linearis]|uniref:L-serine dehydratase n=1 Tax=Carboxylicivirga linearis TaxID=1628157 RepID=A0ABS5JSU5_9BACT|nr:L-serine ammonia-lyase [Carboxylicivirga linearis]MBS2097986.1 L-serine ammonia-lyase [Carboxylicivirga linearis]